jgi:2-iminobutanoate/2-iminopropanoate deaminase
MLNMEKIETKLAPSAIGPYSQGVKIGSMIYTSGQIPIDPATGSIVDGGIEEQATQVMKNLEVILNQAGSKMDKIVKTTCFITSMDDFAKFNEIYAKFIRNAPARSCVEVSKLPKNVLCEVEVIATI